jgi:SAM-dependent methyltransferase
VPVSQRSQLRRKQLGAWYTPQPLVDAVAAEVLHGFAPHRVLDPACGDGRFLAPFPGARFGVDIDAAAVAALPDTIDARCDDSLRREWGHEQFDAVVGNPPFLNQLSAATSRGGASRFGGGPYADAAAEFLALAVRLTRPGGRVGLVLPQSLLSARDAAAIRAAVDSAAALRWMWWSPTKMFDANVRVWAGVWQVGGAPDLVRRAVGPQFTPTDPMPMPNSWSSLLTGHEDAPCHGPTLSSIASFTVDFRDQYYGLVGAVSDVGDGPPLITSGLIDPGVCHWGRRPARFARQQFTAPRVDVGALSPKLQQWAAQRLTPKILIANQTSAIEAVHDPRGEWLPSVPVITCTTDEPDRVLAVLASQQATRFVQQHAAGSGLSASAVRLNPGLLGRVPLGQSAIR